MITLASIQPLYLLIRVGLLLAGSLLLWIGGRFLAKIPRATFLRSLLACLLIAISSFLILMAYTMLLHHTDINLAMTLLAKVIAVLLAFLISWCIIKLLFSASWPRAILAWLPTLIISALLLIFPGIVQPKAEPIPLEISYETTRVLGPLNPDGTVNYLAAINDRYSDGVTPQNNAAVLLLQAIGPAELPQAVVNEVFAALAIPPLPEKGDYFVVLSDYTNGSAEIDETFTKACQAPWSAQQYPQLAAWLEANQTPLELATQAAARPRYYMPLVSADDPPTIASALLPSLQYTRAIAQALIARAMLKIHSDDPDGAQADLLSVHRLARLIGQGPTLIDGLVACTLEQMACEADNALAAGRLFTATQAKAYLSELQALPPLPAMVEAMDVAERFMLLDSITLIHRKGYTDAVRILRAQGASEEYAKELMEQLPPASDVDWNEVLRTANSWYDRMVAAGHEETFAERQQAFDNIQTALEAMSMDIPQPTASTSEDSAEAKTRAPRSSRLEASQALAGFLLSRSVPAFGRVSAVTDQATANLQLSKLALALAAHKAENCFYPESLSGLCPKYLQAVPDNLFTGQPLDYQRTENGYKLSCPGPYPDKEYDDILIQVPVPAVEEENAI